MMIPPTTSRPPKSRIRDITPPPPDDVEASATDGAAGAAASGATDACDVATPDGSPTPWFGSSEKPGVGVRAELGHIFNPSKFAAPKPTNPRAK